MEAAFAFFLIGLDAGSLLMMCELLESLEQSVMSSARLRKLSIILSHWSLGVALILLGREGYISSYTNDSKSALILDCLWIVFSCITLLIVFLRFFVSCGETVVETLILVAGGYPGVGKQYEAFVTVADLC